MVLCIVFSRPSLYHDHNDTLDLLRKVSLIMACVSFSVRLLSGEPNGKHGGASEEKNCIKGWKYDII